MDQQNSHGQPAQSQHDLYVHGNNTAANNAIAEPQYHPHSHMHRKSHLNLSIKITSILCSLEPHFSLTLLTFLLILFFYFVRYALRNAIP